MASEMETLYNARFIISSWGKHEHQKDNDDLFSLSFKCGNTGTLIEMNDLIIHSPYKERLEELFKNKEHVQISITSDYIDEVKRELE